MNSVLDSDSRAPADETPAERAPGRRRALLVALLLAAGLAGAFLWWYAGREAPRPASAPTAPAGSPPGGGVLPPLSRAPGTGIQHPIEKAQTAGDAPTAAPPAPLPSLAESDGALRAALAGLLPRGVLERFFVTEEIVRRIVVTVDNVGRAQMPYQLTPLKPVPGRYLAGGGEGPVPVSAENAARYTPFVQAIEAVDPKKVAALYARYYPLFQEQYVSLGYPGGYFNDRLVQGIDVLLATPKPAQPLEVVQRKVLYEYADPALEALPAGQKAMLRLGPENADRLRTWLQGFRRAVVGAKPEVAGRG